METGGRSREAGKKTGTPIAASGYRSCNNVSAAALRRRRQTVQSYRISEPVNPTGSVGAS